MISNAHLLHLVSVSGSTDRKEIHKQVMMNFARWGEAEQVCLVLVYLPTTASTVMRLRCGVIPSLRDPHFPKYRLAPDTVAYNLGNTIYALVGSASVFFLIFGLVIFFSVWPYTKRIMILVCDNLPIPVSSRVLSRQTQCRQPVWLVVGMLAHWFAWRVVSSFRD